MKRVFVLLMAIIVLLSALSLSVQAVTPRNNHTIRTGTMFSISETGEARVYMSYEAYEDVMTEAVMTLTIKKRTLLFFWTEVTTFTTSSTSYASYHTFTRQLDERGTYKCEVEYVVYGTAGDPDVIPFEDTVTY